MSYPNLRDFLDALDAAGELHTIDAPVSPILEVTEIADRVSKSPAPNISEAAKITDPRHCHLGGKALLLNNIEGSDIPLVINTFGSYNRMEMALGCESTPDGRGGVSGGFKQIADTLESLVKPEPPVGLMEKMKKGLELAKVASYAPKVVKSGPCQDVVHTGDDIDLFSLPIIKCWPDDGDPSRFGYPFPLQQPGNGRYITFGGIYTIHPDDAGKPDNEPRPSRNVGMYRLQLLDKNKTVMHWHIHHDGARHWREWKKYNANNRTDTSGDSGGTSGGRGMPCAVALGGESVLPYAATAPMPPGISELLLAGFLNKKSIPLVKCKTVDLHVPANAEIIIEGYVSTESGNIDYDPRKMDAEDIDAEHEHFEGPFGDHTGFYSLPDRYPLFTVTAITHRNNPIYPTTVVGLPPHEDYYMGKATERVFLPLLQTIIPDIIDYDLPMFGAFHNCVFVKIKKEYPLQARRVMHAIWGAGQMAWTKMIIVVDHDVDVHDHEAVLFHLTANCDMARDVQTVQGPLDILDHAAPQLGAGTKIGFDATAKIPGEECGGHPVRDWPTRLEMSEEIKQKVEERWGELGL